MATNLEVTGWLEEVELAAEVISYRISRKDLRTRVGQYLRGLICRIERENGWQLAEELGEKSPANMLHFVFRAEWSADKVRDDLQRLAVFGQIRIWNPTKAGTTNCVSEEVSSEEVSGMNSTAKFF